MKRLTQLLKNETFFFLFFSILILSVNLLPTIYRYAITPPDRVYAGTEFYSDDYAVYTSTIQQGIDGSWLALDKYTSEDFRPTLFHFHYIMLGKIGKLLGFSSILTYHITRLAEGAVFLVLIYLLVCRLVPKEGRRLAFLFILFSYSWPKFDPSGEFWWQKIQAVFVEPNPVVRFATQPHFLLGHIYTIITILFFSKFWYQQEEPLRVTRVEIFYLIFSAYTALADPAQTLVILLAIAFYIIFLVVKTILNKQSLETLKPMVITLGLTILSVIPIFIYFRLLNNIEPWKIISTFDDLQLFPTEFSQFFLSFGPAAIFAILGIFAFFLSYLRNLGNLPSNDQRLKTDLLLFSWIISAIILVFVLSTPLHINRLRFFHTPIFIAIDIFAVSGIFFLSQTLIKIMTSIKSFTFVSVFSVFTLGLAFPIILTGIASQAKSFADTKSALIYVPKNHIDAFTFLHENTKTEDAVLCLYEACNQIPFFSGNTVFLGNANGGTVDSAIKSDIAVKIFSGAIPPDETKDLITKFKIRYFFVGYQENFWQTDFSGYNFLEKIFTNPGVVIWKVK